jgi:hypothetical protein
VRFWTVSFCCLEHSPQKLGSYRSLLSGRGVNVLECFEELSDERAQVGSSLDVQRAFPDMAPKRRCQVACGLVDSANAQRRLTDSCNAPVGGPFTGAVALKEGLGDQVALDVG